MKQTRFGSLLFSPRFVPPFSPPPFLFFFFKLEKYFHKISRRNDRKEYYKITIGQATFRSILVSSLTIKLEHRGTPTKVDTWKFNFPAATKNTDRIGRPSRAVYKNKKRKIKKLQKEWNTEGTICIFRSKRKIRDRLSRVSKSIRRLLVIVSTFQKERRKRKFLIRMKRDYSNYGSWLVNEGSGCTRADKIDAVAAFNAKRQKLRNYVADRSATKFVFETS